MWEPQNSVPPRDDCVRVGVWVFGCGCVLPGRRTWAEKATPPVHLLLVELMRRLCVLGWVVKGSYLSWSDVWAEVMVVVGW